MNALPSLLEVTLLVRTEMACGKSPSSSLHLVLNHRQDVFSKALRQWLIRVEAGQAGELIQRNLPELFKNPLRKSLVSVFERGLHGAPIDSVLAEMEGEIYFATENAYDRRLQTLPFRLMVPLLLLILPAVMLMLVGPVYSLLLNAF